MKVIMMALLFFSLTNCKKEPVALGKSAKSRAIASNEGNLKVTVDAEYLNKLLDEANDRSQLKEKWRWARYYKCYDADSGKPFGVKNSSEAPLKASFTGCIFISEESYNHLTN